MEDLTITFLMLEQMSLRRDMRKIEGWATRKWLRWG